MRARAGVETLLLLLRLDAEVFLRPYRISHVFHLGVWRIFIVARVASSPYLLILVILTVGLRLLVLSEVVRMLLVIQICRRLTKLFGCILALPEGIIRSSLVFIAHLRLFLIQILRPFILLLLLLVDVENLVNMSFIFRLRRCHFPRHIINIGCQQMIQKV